MIVAVGSTNPAKAEAVRQAFARVWPAATPTVEAVDVRPGTPTRPMSDAECIEGARTRAILAREALDAKYGVGIEAGLVHVGGLWFNGGWAVVTDQKFREGLGGTVRVPVPPSVIRRIEHGAELEALAAEAVVADAGQGYIDAVIAALARFLDPGLFD